MPFVAITVIRAVFLYLIFICFLLVTNHNVYKQNKTNKNGGTEKNKQKLTIKNIQRRKEAINALYTTPYPQKRLK